MPVAGLPQGDYAPIQLLIPPQKKQMYVVGTEFKISQQLFQVLKLQCQIMTKILFQNLMQMMITELA